MPSQSEIFDACVAATRAAQASGSGARLFDPNDMRHRVHVAGPQQYVDAFLLAAGWNGRVEDKPFCVDVSAAKVSGYPYFYCGKKDTRVPDFAQQLDSGIAEMRRIFGTSVRVLQNVTERQVTSRDGSLVPLRFFEVIIVPSSAPA